MAAARYRRRVQRARSGERRAYVEPTFGQRLLARFVDGLIVSVPALILRLLPGGISLGVVLWFAYEIGFTARDGRTVGKRLLGTRVETVDGGDATVRQVVIRAVVLGLGLVVTMPLALGRGFAATWMFVIVLPALAPPLHRGIHDRLAGT